MRVQNKVTEFHISKGKMTDLLTAHIMNVLYKHQLSKKIYIAFCGDMPNTDFGGAARRGTNNVFVRQKTSN
jgi:hypothetical protein